MYKLVILFVALLAVIVPSSSQSISLSNTMPVSTSPSASVMASTTLSNSVSNLITPTPSGSWSVSLTITVSTSISLSGVPLSSGASASGPALPSSGSNTASMPMSLTATASAPLSLSGSGSLLATPTPTSTGSISLTLSNSVSGTMTGTPSTTITASTTLSESQTPTSSVTDTISMTGTGSMTGSISSSFSSSLSAPPSITATMSAAPPPTALTQVTAGCGNSRKMLCVSWNRPVGVPALNYLVTVTGTVSGKTWVQNFTMGETFAMFTGLQPSTAYVVTVQTLFLGTLSSAATLSITTNSPSPKQLPSLGITGFQCRSSIMPAARRKREITCTWTNGSVAYTFMNLRIKCTGKQGSAWDGKHRRVRTMVDPGASSHIEKGFFPNARCKIIMNPSYATGPGRRVVQTIEVV